MTRVARNRPTPAIREDVHAYTPSPPFAGELSIHLVVFAIKSQRKGCIVTRRTNPGTLDVSCRRLVYVQCTSLDTSAWQYPRCDLTVRSSGNDNGGCTLAVCVPKGDTPCFASLPSSLPVNVVNVIASTRHFGQTPNSTKYRYNII